MYGKLREMLQQRQRMQQRQRIQRQQQQQEQQRRRESDQTQEDQTQEAQGQRLLRPSASAQGSRFSFSAAFASSASGRGLYRLPVMMHTLQLQMVDAFKLSNQIVLPQEP